MSPEDLTKWREAFGGRRFLMTMGAGVVNLLLVWAGKITGEQYLMLTMGTVAVYIGAGTYEKVKGNVQTP